MNNLQEKRLANDCYTINNEFLKAKGIILVSTGAMFTTHEFENERYHIRLTEYSDLIIINKKSGKKHSVNLVTQLLTDKDL